MCLISSLTILKLPKPFYHRVDPEDEKYVLCHDLLAPEGYGEIIGGGERTWTEKEILERIDEEGTPRDPYQFYIDVSRTVAYHMEALALALTAP